MISPSSSIASLHPATSAKVVFGMSLVISFAFDLANCMTPRPPPPCMLFISHRKTTKIKMSGRKVPRIVPSRLGVETSVVYSSMSPLAIWSSTRVSISAWVSVSQ